MPRFVVLRHEMPPGSPRAAHWDLMLEEGGVLWTWAMEELPRGERTIAARRLPDHRLAYLEYEGPVSRQRGDVARWDAGTYQWLERREGLLRFQLYGAKLQGTVALARPRAPVSEALSDEPAAQFWALSMSQS